MEVKKISNKDILKNMYGNLFCKLYQPEDYFTQKKVTQERKDRLFDNLKLAEIKTSLSDIDVPELIQLKRDINKDLNLFDSYLTENYSFKKVDNFFLYFVIPSLLISLLIILIHPLLYVICYCMIIYLMSLFITRIHNKIKLAYMINMLYDQIKIREPEIKKEQLKNAILSCISSNNNLEVVDKDLSKIQYSQTSEIEVPQNHFIIELVGLIRLGKVKILSQQKEITKSIADKFRLPNQTEINSDSLYKEFNKYYKMDEKEFNNLYQNILS